MLVQTTTNIEKSMRTARQMAEAQRDSYAALAENFATAQRRTIGLAEGGLTFMRLQEENARAAQEWFASGVRLLQLQQRNAEFVQGWTTDAVEVVREQTEQNVRTAEAFARGISKQQEGFRALTQVWAGTYRGDFFSPFAYFQEGVKTVQRATQQGLEATGQVARQGLRVAEETTQQGLRVAEETTRQGLRVAEEATEQTDEVLRQTEKVTREAELRIAVLGALETADYEELTVDEISGRLDDLSVQQLEQVREYEKLKKDRQSLIEQIDRKIRAKNT
jgi:hypothetical protein